MIRLSWILLFFILCLGLLNINANDDPKPVFPLQFSANLDITSHLIDESSSYPPKRRRITIYYDFINKKARADIEGGYEAAKYYIRRYDLNKEYMIRLKPIDDCKRSYLGETMPYPKFPDSSVYSGIVEVNGELAYHFIHEEFDIRVHFYFSVEEGIPLKLDQESIEEDGTIVPLLTYEFSDFQLDPPDDLWFELPSEVPESSCIRHVGGFPYLHIFHYFIKF